MIFQDSTYKIFLEIFNRLGSYQKLVKNYKAIIGFSGGKDSTLLAYFYKFLNQEKLCPEPILFHLDHSIRNNFEQEEEIELYMKDFFSNSIYKKKTFQKSRSI